MKSGLEDRNNFANLASMDATPEVSMKSGLEDRNNWLSAEALEFGYFESQ